MSQQSVIQKEDLELGNLPRIGVGVLIFNDKNEILLGKRLVANGYGDWAPPGGHLECGESLEDCAVREVFEETGLQIASPKFLALTNNIFENTGDHYLSALMTLAFPEGQDILNIEPEKTKEWCWFPFNNLPENLFLPLKSLQDGSAYFSDVRLIHLNY